MSAREESIAAQALLKAADEISALGNDHELGPGWGDEVDRLRRMAAEAGKDTRTAGESTQPDDGADFFQPGHTYVGSYGWRFRCDTVTIHPEDGELTALGWRYWDGWHPHAYHRDDWEVGQAVGWTDATRPDGGGQEREPLLLRWTRVVSIPDWQPPGDATGTGRALVHCQDTAGVDAVLVLEDHEQRQALASLLDARLVDIHRPCGTEGCGTLEDLDPSDPVMWGWVRLQVAAVDDAPRWWCSSMCAWSALARAGEELAAQDRAAADDIGGDL